MITLYELHWSHYCEKIRWALDYKKIPFKKVNVNIFTKPELQNFPRKGERHLVPTIYDEKTQQVVEDSSPILRYLDEAYPETPTLFPPGELQKKLIYEWIIELDSKLAVTSRKLGYTQIILENPGILAKLFLPNIANGMLTLPVIRRLSGGAMGMLLIKRFQFELNEKRHLYEELEIFLLKTIDKLQGQQYMFNNTFGAADLTLATCLRPLHIIPFFRENPKLAPLFEWQRQMLQAHHREPELLYETLIKKNREKQPPMRRGIQPDFKKSDFFAMIDQQNSETTTAFNDHELVWTWKALLTPFHYFFTIRKNKFRQRAATENIR
jgi:glutathione S-transferase